MKKNGAEFSLTVENMAGLQFTVAYVDGSDKMKLQVEGQDFDNLDQAAVTSSILYAVEIIRKDLAEGKT